MANVVIIGNQHVRLIIDSEEIRSKGSCNYAKHPLVPVEAGRIWGYSREMANNTVLKVQ